MIAGRVPGRKMNLFNMALDLIIFQGKIAAALLLSVCYLIYGSCSHWRFSNLFQLLSDKGEYKEAMEVLKKALKLEPATKVRLCGGAGPSHRYVSSKSACESRPSLTRRGERSF